MSGEEIDRLVAHPAYFIIGRSIVPPRTPRPVAWLRSNSLVAQYPAEPGARFVYNAAGAPIATGLLYPVFGILLSPIIGAAAMALSR